MSAYAACRRSTSGCTVPWRRTAAGPLRGRRQLRSSRSALSSSRLAASSSLLAIHHLLHFRPRCERAKSAIPYACSLNTISQHVLSKNSHVLHSRQGMPDLAAV